jgi:hypothetical protein
MLLGALLACVAAFIGGAAMRAVALVPFAVVGGIIVLFLLSGMFIVNPNEAKVLCCSASTPAACGSRACTGPIRFTGGRRSRCAFTILRARN